MKNLNELLVKDKFTNMDQISSILKDEVACISQNFFVLASEPIVRFRREGDNIVFNVEIEASRIKPFGSRF